MPEDDFYKTPTIPPGGDKSPAEEPREIPKKIGPYKIESLLEKGGMSILYLGTHPQTKEPTTIKVLSPRFLAYTEVVQRFLTEAEIIAMADHPNIIKLYGYGEWEGGLYIAMEFVQGISLRQFILQTPTSLKKALEIIIDISFALCHLHIHGVIHRDLKPENILVTESGMIKVIDFGIAQLLTERTNEEVQLKQKLIGTPIYMSPEQRENPESVSFPSDIYSLGIIAYELILGKLSHGQIHLSLMPKGIQSILKKTLQPDIKDRYQDIVDFIVDLTSYMNSPNFQKEKKVGDQLSELSDNLKKAQSILLSEKTPKWPKQEIGIAVQKNIFVAGVFHDFISMPDHTYAIIMGESSSKDAEGFIYSAKFLGLIRALAAFIKEPEKIALILNKLLIEDKREQFFSFNYLLLLPEKNRAQFIACGCSNLWIIPADTETPTKIATKNPALGIDLEAKFTELSFSWNPGDIFVLGNFVKSFSSFDQETEFTQENFRSALIENLDTPPQKLVETILRKVKAAGKTFLDYTICLISISYTRNGNP